MEQTTRSPILCEAKDYRHRPLRRRRATCWSRPRTCPSSPSRWRRSASTSTNSSATRSIPATSSSTTTCSAWATRTTTSPPSSRSSSRTSWWPGRRSRATRPTSAATSRGGYNPNAVEVWQEALRIPPVKVVESGKLRKDVWDLIFANIRLDIVQHDMKAEMGACTVGERRLLELLEKYGARELRGAQAGAVRRHAQDDGGRDRQDPQRQLLAAKATSTTTAATSARSTPSACDIEVEDKRIKFDYSRTDPQTNGFVNGTFTSSASATILTLLQMVNPDIPHNEGMVQPIEIVIPEGTILNAAYPKATTFGNHLCPPNADAIQRALAPVMPERVTAGWNNLLASLTTGIDPQQQREVRGHRLHGPEGRLRRHARHRRLRPHRHDRRLGRRARPGLRDVRAADAAHPDQARAACPTPPAPANGAAGSASRRFSRSARDDTQLVTFGDGDFEPAFGLFGGGDGGLNFIRLRYPDGTDRRAAEQGPDHRRAEGHHLPPGGQRRRRLRRSEEARPRSCSPRKCATASSPRGRARRLRRGSGRDDRRSGSAALLRS